MNLVLVNLRFFRVWLGPYPLWLCSADFVIAKVMTMHNMVGIMVSFVFLISFTFI